MPTPFMDFDVKDFSSVSEEDPAGEQCVSHEVVKNYHGFLIKENA